MGYVTFMNILMLKYLAMKGCMKGIIARAYSSKMNT